MKRKLILQDQEILTDPSYCKQIVALTYPIIDHYDTAKQFNQSRKSFVNGLVIGELCVNSSSSSMEKIRSAGTMKGVIVSEYTSQNTIRARLSLTDTLSTTIRRTA